LRSLAGESVLSASMGFAPGCYHDQPPSWIAVPFPDIEDYEEDTATFGNTWTSTHVPHVDPAQACTSSTGVHETHRTLLICRQQKEACSDGRRVQTWAPEHPSMQWWSWCSASAMTTVSESSHYILYILYVCRLKQTRRMPWRAATLVRESMEPERAVGAQAHLERVKSGTPRARATRNEARC